MATISTPAAGSDTPSAPAAPSSDQQLMGDVLAELQAQDAPPAPTGQAEAPPPAAAEEVPPAAAPTPPAPPATETDPVVAARLATIQRAEKRSKDALAEERATLARERAEWSEKVAAATSFSDLAARAKYDPAAVLTSLGLDAGDFEAAAKQLYALSPAGRSDPKNREIVEQQLRLRGHGDELSSTRREVAELRKFIEERDQQAAGERAAAEYLDAAVKSVNGQAPLVAAWIAKNPRAARERMRAVAAELVESTGEVPEHEEVIAAMEKRRRADIEELGVDVGVVLSGSAPAPAPAGRPAPTLGQLGSPAQARATPQTREEVEADVLRAMQEGRLD